MLRFKLREADCKQTETKGGAEKTGGLRGVRHARHVRWPRALDKFAGDLRATHPHFVYAPHGEPQVLHNSARLAWGSGPKGETPAYTGVDFIITRDGKIAALYVLLSHTSWDATNA
jgi:hypothetical protein